MKEKNETTEQIRQSSAKSITGQKMNGGTHSQRGGKKPMRPQQKLRWARIAVQIVFFILAPALFSQAFSGVKEAFTAIGSGNVLRWTNFSIRLVILLAVTVLFGRIFCGWACAFGTLSDWIYQIIGVSCKKAGVKRPQIPAKAVWVLQKLKYVVLAVILLLCFMQEGSIVTQYSPWTVFSLLTARNLRIGAYVPAIVLLCVIIVGMAVQERFFCQFLCPLGAIFSLLPELPFTALKRHKENCPAKCNICQNNCPVRLKLGKTEIREGECIRCGRCVAGCPQKNIKVASCIIQSVESK